MPIAHGRICRVQIGMLGSFEVRTDNGVFADVPGARLRGLLIALALEPGRVVPKATLVDWIWGERPPSEAANALYRLVSRLRKALPEGSVEGQTDGYRLTAYQWDHFSLLSLTGLRPSPTRRVVSGGGGCEGPGRGA
jgi:hypothetical protein